MQVLTTVTQKGQITLPKSFRDDLGLLPYKKAKVVKAKDHIKIYSPGLDILDISPIGKAPKGMDALKAREYMEKHYKRF